MISLKVHGMTCGGCVSKVKHAVNSLDQSANVHIDLKSGLVEVQSRHPTAEIVKIIKTLGYEVTNVTEGT
uniref:Copper chaperone CopZ n=3 Tax=Candidatus Berkiella aquae TaxID=295108 RepID=A0A0Q9YUK0_9GAMM